MTYSGRTSAKKTPRVLGLILVLSLLLMRSGGSVGASTALGTPGTLGTASAGAQGDVPPVAANGDWDWPQVQRDPQRTGYTPEVLGTDYEVAWSHNFYPERVFPQVQAIVCQGKVYVGTEYGNMYAFDAETGEQRWVYPVDAPVLASVACGGSKVFFGTMDGAVYALGADTGTLAWRTQLSQRVGLSTAPVLAEDKVMLGGRSGIFYALDFDGNALWQRDVGAPILQTAAYNDGRVFFGAMDMHVYAFNTADGTLAWRSGELNGLALKDYWPVVYQGTVLVRSACMGAESNVCENFYALDEGTGAEAVTLPLYCGMTQHGATAPPAIDRDGYLIVPVQHSDGYHAGIGRLALDTQQIVESLGDRYTNPDETMNWSCAANVIIALHFEGGQAFDLGGVYDLDSNAWLPWHRIGLPEPWYNTQGGGINPPSIANGRFYHISFHRLTAWMTQ
jgi:outer membrane protein assembly factor BamB